MYLQYFISVCHRLTFGNWKVILLLFGNSVIIIKLGVWPLSPRKKLFDGIAIVIYLYSIEKSVGLCKTLLYNYYGLKAKQKLDRNDHEMLLQYVQIYILI